MADKIREAMVREKARLLEQVAAIDRDIAEHDRIRAKYNRAGRPPGSKQAPRGGRKSHKRERQAAAEGSVSDLVSRYRAHERSPYHKLRYRTKQSYDSLLKRIVEDHGDKRLADLKAQNIQGFYEDWTPRGEAMARSLITMFRMLFGFGAMVLEDENCERLSAVMHRMRFKMGKPRNERLTAVQADAIRAKAHEMGCPSIALAQALQFETPLSQKDVIGEWVPISEQGEPSEVIRDEMKWLRGLRWSAIDQNWILRHGASRGGQYPVEIDLRNLRMVREELTARFGDALPTGREPVIVSEYTKLPFTAHEFRRRWRIVARAAGVSDKVYNMDSRTRAGGVQGLVSDEIRATEGAPSVARI